MTKSEFITTEIIKFDIRKPKPFRIGVTDNHDGADYPYGIHAELTDCFNDVTVGFATQIPEACEFLAIAWDKAASNNGKFSAELPA